MATQQYAVANWFSNAHQAKSLLDAEAEIQRLQEEINQLRQKGAPDELKAQLKALREELQSQSGILSIPIDKIEPNPEQPRQTFLPDSIEALACSLAREGQLEPVILIEGDPYLIFDGERRWRGAKYLGWTSLKAVIIPEPERLHRKALLTSLHREDLNPLDKAEAIVKEIAHQTSLRKEETPRILSTVVRRLNKQRRMSQVVELMTVSSDEREEKLSGLGLDEKESQIVLLLLDLQLNPASVDANIFPMLSLANDLKKAIRESGLKGGHAMALQTLNSKNLNVRGKKATIVRKKATVRVLKENLSAAQTRRLVRDIRSEYRSVCCNESNKVVNRLVNQIQKLDLSNLSDTNYEQLQHLQEVFQQKLSEVERLILSYFT